MQTTRLTRYFSIDGHIAKAQAEQTPPKDAAYTLAGLNSLDRAIQMIDANPTFTTGLGGAILSNIPGTTSGRESLDTTVTSQVGFDRLQDASLTGGALARYQKESFPSSMPLYLTLSSLRLIIAQRELKHRKNEPG